MKVEIVTHPHAWETRQARLDEAAITGRHLVERPFWFRNLSTGQLYYSLLGAVGWPTEISDKGKAMPGYIGIIGVVKPKTDGKDIRDAPFQLLAEFESRDVPSLLDAMVSMRKEYGFGLHPDLLQAWFGDPERFITTIALKNERLTEAGRDRAAILIIPPNDFYGPTVFDEYVRSLQSAIMPGRVRFFFGKCDILRKHLRGFTRDNPAVFAVGGLVHTLLGNCEWMDSNRENCFVVEEEG